jgi:hypothetical protein
MMILSLGLLLSLAVRVLAVPAYGAQIPRVLPIDHWNNLAEQTFDHIGHHVQNTEKVSLVFSIIWNLRHSLSFARRLPNSARCLAYKGDENADGREHR